MCILTEIYLTYGGLIFVVHISYTYVYAVCICVDGDIPHIIVLCYVEIRPSAYLKHYEYPLILWCRVTHICVSILAHHWFRKWLVARSVPSDYQNQCWNIVNWTFGNKLQRHFNRNAYIFVQENEFEKVICKMAVILFGIDVFKGNYIHGNIDI